jgi:negative regulator of replication initiation
MLTNPKLGASVADDTIMFGELSSDIQKRLLDFAGVSHPSEKFWDVLPVAYIYQNKAQMSQEEIDDEALLQLRVI